METGSLPLPPSLYFISLSLGASFIKSDFSVLNKLPLCWILVYSHLPLHPSAIDPELAASLGQPEWLSSGFFKSRKSQPLDPSTTPGWDPLALSHLPILQMEKVWFREGHLIYPSTLLSTYIVPGTENPRRTGVTAGCVNFRCC